MSTVTDDIEFDDDEDTQPAPATRTARSTFAGLVARWKGWPLWAKVVSVPVGGWLAIVVVGFVLGMLATVLGLDGGGSDETPSAPASTTSTVVDTADALVGLPPVAPIVAAAVKPADRAEFRNRVNAVTADGTSICDVFFGITVEERADGTQATEWQVTTPAMQFRSGVGVQLPSSTWPVRAFYGGVCDVPARDVPLPTTTTTVTSTAVAPGE